MNRITYGLSKACIWPITATAADGTPTYGERIDMPGARSITLDPAGESVDIYADNGVWFSVGSVNNGYTGSYNFSRFPMTTAKKSLRKQRTLTASGSRTARSSRQNLPLAIRSRATSTRQDVFSIAAPRAV